MKGLGLSCCLFVSSCCWAQNIVTNPNVSKATVQTANLDDGVRYVDPGNSAKWKGAANCTRDLGLCLDAAIADLPTRIIKGAAYRWGTIFVSPGDYSLMTRVSPGPLVSIEMAGPNSVRITSEIDGDAFTVRDSPFNNNRGSSIGGFTLIGPGRGDTHAVGIHTGDLNFAHFHDIAIGGFTGTNASCFWVDDQAGWFERNTIEHVSLGEVQTATGNQSLGCTKLVRFTGNSSFGYNEWLGLRLAPQASGEIGFSLEAGSLYRNYITGNANVAAGATLFSISGTGGGDGSFIDFRAECTNCASDATGWSIGGGLSYSYTGPGIITGQDPHIVNSISGNLIPMLASDITQSGYAAGSKMLWIPTQSGQGGGQINEAIGLGDSPVNWGSGIGAVEGTNIAHPIVWGYAMDANCFEAYSKAYQTPLTSSNRIAALPCGLGNADSHFVLDNAPQTLTNKTMAGLTVRGPLSPNQTTVGALPSPSSAGGQIFVVTDSTMIRAEGQPCVGDSNRKALAFSDGLTWKCF